MVPGFVPSLADGDHLSLMSLIYSWEGSYAMHNIKLRQTILYTSTCNTV